MPVLALPTKPTKDFSIYSVENLVDNSVTDFDLFINLEKHFILYSGRGYKWQRAELMDLLELGHKAFFIRNGDLSRAQMYATIVRLPQVEKDLAPKERIVSIEQVGAKFVECLYQGEITPGCVQKAETITSAMVDCIKEDPSCVAALGGLADHDYYTYFHSVRVASYAVAIALTMGQDDPKMLREIALGGVFHDIGKKEVPMSVINKSGPLTEAEWKMMKSHPELGFEKVSETILSHVPREIVMHHHEKRNGKGYPDGLDAGSILPEVQIATLADIFDALTSSRSYQNKRTKYEALDFIKHRLVKEEVCPDAFKALVMCLAAA